MNTRVDNFRSSLVSGAGSHESEADIVQRPAAGDKG